MLQNLESHLAPPLRNHAFDALLNVVERVSDSLRVEPCSAFDGMPQSWVRLSSPQARVWRLPR